MTITKITSPFHRELTVEKDSHATYLQVTGDDWGTKHDVKTFLAEEQVTELIDALLGENSTVVTDLPEAKLSGEWVEAGPHSRHTSTSPYDLTRVAKSLLAIAAKITEMNTEKAEAEAKAAEAEKAKEAARDKRRDELADKFNRGHSYSSLGTSGQRAIDYIIDLEEAAKV